MWVVPLVLREPQTPTLLTKVLLVLHCLHQAICQNHPSPHGWRGLPPPLQHPLCTTEVNVAGTETRRPDCRIRSVEEGFHPTRWDLVHFSCRAMLTGVWGASINLGMEKRSTWTSAQVPPRAELSPGQRVRTSTSLASARAGTRPSGDAPAPERNLRELCRRARTRSSPLRSPSSNTNFASALANSAFAVSTSWRSLSARFQASSMNHSVSPTCSSTGWFQA